MVPSAIVGLLGLVDFLRVLGLGARWSAYTDDQAVSLGFVLLAFGLACVFSGAMIKGKVFRIRQRITGIAGLLVFATWVFSVFVVFFFFDLLNSGGGLVASPVGPVTYSAAGVTFVAIFVSIFLRNKRMVKAGIMSAFVGTVFGVMVFELPFLFIISPRIGLPLDRALLGESPLFCLVFASYSLIALSPFSGLSRYTLFSLGGVFFVLASWAFMTNFAFPSESTSLVLNSAAKGLGYLVAFTLFLHKAT